MYKYLFLLLCLFWNQNANAFCRTIIPQITVETNPGTVRYQTHLSREEFIKYSPVPQSPYTVGLTHTPLSFNQTAMQQVQQLDDQLFCAQIKELKLIMGYDVIDVFIDKKYPPGSCEYEVVKEHENYHVRVAQEAMMFFKPDVEAALEKAVSQLSPVYVSSEAQAREALDQQINQVMTYLAPLLQHINQKIVEKNYIIDTPESYQETTALCDHW